MQTLMVITIACLLLAIIAQLQKEIKLHQKSIRTYEDLRKEYSDVIAIQKALEASLKQQRNIVMDKDLEVQKLQDHMAKMRESQQRISRHQQEVKDNMKTSNINLIVKGEVPKAIMESLATSKKRMERVQ